ncbi:MAG: aminodeoxychorismate synthase component I [Peptoniphilaceae bacterium]
MKTLIIDNYDSYTYNLYQLIAKVSGEEPIVIKNDEMPYEKILELKFDNVVISPGPGSPEKEEDFGVCKRIIQELDKPIFGVCLGQQGIYYYNGGEIVLAPTPMHGRISRIKHNNRGLFRGIKQDFKVTRYHSLVCQEGDLENISIDARSEDGLIMAISHKKKPIYAVQFHPESICTEYGEEMVRNFLDLSKEYYLNNSQLRYEVLDKRYESKDIFESLHEYDSKVLWLDSSKIEKDLSRFSIFGMSSPCRGHILKYNTDKKELEKIYDSGKKEVFNISIFDYLKENKLNWQGLDELPCDFQLGYIGYLGYELKKECIVENKHSYNYPDAYFRYVDRAIIIDHLENKVYVLSYKDDFKWIEKVKILLEEKKEKISYVGEIRGDYPRVNFVRDKETYIKDIEKSKYLIRQGETYEVCVTNRLDINDKVKAVDYYMILRQVSPAPYAALLNFDEISIACSSMERFINIDRDNIVETKPIKGTIRRGINKEEDEELIRELSSDEKTMSENLMIVDLLRNDLGKVCQVGSVEVPKLMDVETYSTLHQLVSTVKGKIDSRYDGIDVLKASFPGGSMTGAPKKRTLEIIDDIENMARGVYSGAIGYISNNGSMDFNIVIRTALIEKEKVTIGVGGAIIDLSSPEEEFEEILLKAKGILTAFKLYYKGNLDQDIFIEGSV